MPTSPFVFRRKGRRPAAVPLVAAVLALGLAGCGGGGNGNVTRVTRPHTSAQLQILSPTEGEVTGPNVMLEFKVIGATVSPPNKLKLVSNQGHIHVSLDGKLVLMSYGTTTEVHDLTPGPHDLQAQFVANDHLPFADPVDAYVNFTVRG